MIKLENLYKKATPAHIGLKSWLPNYNFSPSLCKVRVEESEREGKYQVANKQLCQGDIVLKEEPFIRQLNKCHYKDHCYYCFRSLVTKPSVKCHVKTCRWDIIYCDSICEEKSWLTGHAWLCRFPELNEDELQDVLFAFVGLITSRSKGHNVLPGLVSNEEENEKSLLGMEVWNKIITIVDLFSLSDQAIKSMRIILSQIRCNSFAVKQAASVAVDSSYVVSRESIYLGQAVYLTASRFNHSCDPNALVVFGGDDNPLQLQTQITKGPVIEGQSVTISYGPLATKHSKEVRQKKLKEKYFFDCQCSACRDSSDNSPDCIYKCQFCKSSRLYRQQHICKQCDQKPYWPYFLKTEAEIERYKQQQDYLKVLQLQENIYHADTLPVGETCDKLAQIYCVSGQMRLAAKYCKLSLEVTKSIYGKISIETAEEMMKLSTLLFNSMQKAEAIKQINETMIVYRILGLNNSAPEDIEELEDMKNHLLYIVR